MRVLVVAEGAPGIQVLRALRERKHEIVAVMANPDETTTQGASMWQLAEHLGLPTWPAERVADHALGDKLRDDGVDLLLNVYSLRVVSEGVLVAPRLGSYNLHPSPLPAYAGLNSVCWAIYHGEPSHGVTVHRMDPEVDSGPIAYQETFPIDPSDTGLSVSTRCIRIGVKLMVRLIDAASRDPADIPAIKQDPRRRSFFGGGVPHEGRLSWNVQARSAIDFVRACDFSPLTSPWGHPIAVIEGHDFEVVKLARTGSPVEEPPGSTRWDEDGSLSVACSDEWVQVVEAIDRARHLPAIDALESRRGESNP